MARVVIRRQVETTAEEGAARDALRLYGVPSLKLTPRGQRGWQDRLFLVPGGRPLFVEFKVPGEDLRPLQEHRREVLEKLGYDVEVHDGRQGAVDAVRRAVERARPVRRPR